MLALVSLLFFTFTELHYDVTQSLSTAFYAERLGDLPGNLARSWDHRGYAHKLVTYLCYQTAAVLFEPATYWFERVFKLVYALSFGALVAGAAFAAREKLSQLRCGWTGVAATLICCCFSVSSWCGCQPEHSAAIIAISATLFLLGKDRFTLAVAAVLAGACFFFKAVTLSFAIQPLFLAVLCGESFRARRLKSYCLLASCIFLALLALTALGAKSELVDLYYGAEVLRTFDRPWSERLSLAVLGLPFNWLQMAVFPLVAILCVLHPPRRHELVRALPAFSVAVLPLLVQGRSYAYHQLNYLPVASCAVIVLLHKLGPPNWKQLLSWRMTCALGVCLVPQLLVYPLMGKTKFLANLEFSRPAKVPPAWSPEVNTIRKKMRGRRALFATWGDAPYLLQIEPSQKYFTYHLFFGIDRDLHLRPGCVRDFRDHWLSYQGHLIVAGEQLKQLDRYPAIASKVWSEYELFHREEHDRYPASRNPTQLFFLRRKDGGPFAEMGPTISLD